MARRITMFRPSIHYVFSRGTCSRPRRSLTAPLVLYTRARWQIVPHYETGAQHRDRNTISTHSHNSEQNNRPQLTYPFLTTTKPKLAFSYSLFSRVSSTDSPLAAEESETRINYQDVRDHGPLFNLEKAKLEADHEIAQKQWRDLCAAHGQKQEIVNALWKKNEELEARCKAAEAMVERTQALLHEVVQEREEADEDDSILKDKLIRIEKEIELQCSATKQPENHNVQDEGKQQKTGNDNMRNLAWTLGFGLVPLMLYQFVFSPMQYF
ncbi:hypothetical protein GGS24DRAFT_173590 [Hypoxylon argillaceum]|nr:hypothetical protein GGS24DRAFT_173590 [Hypoxylon argillaceum]KAI1150809.1 hypothetical protein F4825DRAFT_389655 [Nemania diffusa]